MIAFRPGNRCRRIISHDSQSDEDEWSENDKDTCLEEYQRTSGVNIIPKNKESVLDRYSNADNKNNNNYADGNVATNNLDNIEVMAQIKFCLM
uniref:Uncharacterized protein n=1 Tax=Glossina austeni TaxID=7395 RepID=A0A1A9VGR3_GLOAU